MHSTVFIPHAASRAAEQAAGSLRIAGYTVLTGVAPGKISQCGTSAAPLEHPCPVRQHHAFRDWLGSWLVENPQSWVLPIDEAVVHAAASLAGDVHTRERLVLPSGPSLAASLSKYHANRQALALGLSIPETRFIRPPGLQELSSATEPDAFPKLLKWDNAESSEGTYQKGGNRIVGSEEEFQACCAELLHLDCGIILQDLVPGHGVGAFFLRHRGKIVLRFAHRRLHEVPWTGGVSACCESSDHAEILEAGERLLEAIDYEGVAMVEFRKETGKPPVFLEINGRLWGSLGLALAAGADFPRAMVECHLHGKTEVKQPDLSRRVRWHDPSLQMDYLRSLWAKAPGPIDGPAPRWRGTLRVLGCFLDPRVKSDWWEWENPITSLKRYARIWRRELAWLKAQCLQRFNPKGPHPLVTATVERTRQWSKNPDRPTTILFLCYGNILRSPYAESRWNAWRHDQPGLPSASSAGFHDNTNRETPARFQSAAAHRGVDLTAHRSRRVVAGDVSDASVVFAMDLRNLKDMQREFPEALCKTVLLGALGDAEDPEIPDPYGQQIGAGGATYRRIDAALDHLRILIATST